MTRHDPHIYDPDENSRKAYDLTIGAIREICVRKGDIEPKGEREKRWAKEGPRSIDNLETLKAQTR